MPGSKTVVCRRPTQLGIQTRKCASHGHFMMRIRYQQSGRAGIQTSVGIIRRYSCKIVGTLLQPVSSKEIEMKRWSKCTSWRAVFLQFRLISSPVPKQYLHVSKTMFKTQTRVSRCGNWNKKQSTFIYFNQNGHGRLPIMAVKRQNSLG